MNSTSVKLFSKIKSFIDTLIVIVIVLYLAVVLMQRVSGNNSVLGYRFFNVASESMDPIYKVNDIIAVKDCSAYNLNIGDDIAYKGEEASLSGKIITHRIQKINKDNGDIKIITKGINNVLEDPEIGKNQVLGKVVGVVPVISLINHLVMTQAGFFFIIFVPIVLMVCMEIAETIIDNKLEKEELRKINN